MNRQIGKVTRKIIEILDLKYNKEELIFIGEANILHMKKEHPDDFNKYSDDIEEIINNPTYLARNIKKNSIEFIKEYKENNEFVLIAVRASNKNVHFARTMYVMSLDKVNKYIRNNYFFKF